MTARLVIIADDLTGAADTAACFAQAGLRTVVALTTPETEFWLLSLQNSVSSDRPPAETGFSGKNPVSFDVLSLSTNSRELSAGDAARQVRQAVDWLQHNGCVGPETFFYKKVDSMMRGHPAVELAAMQAALGLDRALLAPAFPAQGRLTLAGRQVVGDGSAARHIDLGEVFGSGPDGIHWLSLEQARRGWLAGQPGLYIADAESEADLEALAHALLALGFRLACGSAGLGRALQKAGFLPEDRPARAPAGPPAETHPAGRPVLVVAGSRSPALLRQVEAVRQLGIRVVRPDPAFLENKAYPPKELAASLAETLRAGQPAILTTAGLPASPLGDHTVAERLAGVAGWLVDIGLVGGLLLTGGDTAAAVCRRLGATLIELHGEPLPGIAAGALLDGHHAGLPVITKAGAFECDLKLLIDDF
jgi:uncharacterized protein YgbK (DUF1537 family)